MKKQYIVQKYVQADSVLDAVKKAKKAPVHEVFVHNSWLEKQNFEFFGIKTNKAGYEKDND